MMNTLLLIDGNAVMHRAFHALPPLATKEGVPVNAVYGFFTMLHKAISDFQATHIIVSFDTPKPTFRKELMKEYQAHRPKMLNEMGLQFPIVKELLDIGGITRLERPGFEADDVIGTVAEKCKKEPHMRVFILTGDRDILQLVDSNVFVITPLKGVSSIAIYNTQNVLEKYGVLPKQIPDLKALMGDASDNYKGAKGIGPKTAVKLLQKFVTVENLLNNLDELEEGRVKSLVLDNIESIKMSKQLATILKDVEVEWGITESEYHGFKPQMREALQKLELYSLIGRIYGANNNKPVQYTSLIDSPEPKVSKKTPEDPQLDLFS